MEFLRAERMSVVLSTIALLSPAFVIARAFHEYFTVSFKKLQPLKLVQIKQIHMEVLN